MRRTPVRSALGYLAEVVGVGCVVVGVWEVFPPAALIVAGIGLIVGAQAAGR